MYNEWWMKTYNINEKYQYSAITKVTKNISTQDLSKRNHPNLKRKDLAETCNAANRWSPSRPFRPKFHMGDQIWDYSRPFRRPWYYQKLLLVGEGKTSHFISIRDIGDQWSTDGSDFCWHAFLKVSSLNNATYACFNQCCNSAVHLKNK